MRLAVRPEELNPGYREQRQQPARHVNSVTYLGSIVRIGVRVEGHPLSLDVFNERKFKIPAVANSTRLPSRWMPAG
jgi:putative spermidine/putrescine transport system ATP-binding protein